MVCEYLAGSQGCGPDLRVISSPWDVVFLHSVFPGKLQSWATCPYIFVAYTGSRGFTAYIRADDGAETVISIGNLLLGRTATWT